MSRREIDQFKVTKYLNKRLPHDLEKLITHHNLVVEALDHYKINGSHHYYYEQLYQFLEHFKQCERMHGPFEPQAYEKIFSDVQIFSKDIISRGYEDGKLIYIHDIIDPLNSSTMNYIKKKKSVWSYAEDIATVDEDGNITYKD